MISEASARALDDLISPSAVITLALAALPASASAAIVLCNCSGSRASFLAEIFLNIKYLNIFFMAADWQVMRLSLI